MEEIKLPKELMDMMGWDDNTQLRVTVDILTKALIFEEDADDDS